MAAYLKPIKTPSRSNYRSEAEPELYTTIPKQPKEKKPGQFTPEQLKEFFEDGFVLVPDFFKREELEPVRDGVRLAVDMLANRLYDAGKIKNKHSKAGLFQRLTLIDKEFPGAAVLLIKIGFLPQSFRDLWSNERLLNVMEQLIGPDISGHPVWNLRCKTPRNEETTVPWHQDNAYLDDDALHVLQPTAWIPLLDANENNGCMQVVKGGHKKGITATHTCCAGGTWYVMLSDEEMKKTLGVEADDAVTCEVPYGGVLFLNNAVPHRSLENYSNDIRWSLDLRWQRSDKPNGFYGLKDSIPMRSSTDPNLEIDFDSFDNVDRHKAAHTEAKGEEPDEFNTTIFGPWMKRWDLVNHNRHTQSPDLAAKDA